MPVCCSTVAIIVISVLSFASGDIYLHYPRGSNNRLNEASATRTNNDRLFDSQNNARGGYNKGILNNNDFEEIYYYGASTNGVQIEWTNQHSCGDGRAGCRMVVQTMCQDVDYSDDLTRLRNGKTTDRAAYKKPETNTETKAQFATRKSDSLTIENGVHEPFEWYDLCTSRPRNQNLNNLDQKLNGDASIYTRQNPNGNRRGYECPEERDYYPYWRPTPWMDIAVLTDNSSECDWLQREAVAGREMCVDTFTTNERRWYIPSNTCPKRMSFYPYLEVARNLKTESACNAAGYRWAPAYRDLLDSLTPVCLVPLPKPDCRRAPQTRDNHLGDQVGGGTTSYHWKLPVFPSGRTKKCVLRMRYNLTSQDLSSLINNPLVSPGLQLAINTQQVGRVFQDRSHVFQLQPRRSSWGPDGTVYQCGVRGKRGNIVQVYPAVEYDFVPSHLSVRVNDILVIQWSGSNTHNNQGPGGDGQTGSDGSGQVGTDRHNLLQIPGSGDNFPLAAESANFWDSVQILDVDSKMNKEDWALRLASGGYYQCVKDSVCSTSSAQSKATLDGDLNLAEPSMSSVAMRITKSGTFHFMCSRNNNFSNRSQKFTLIVV